MSWKVCYTDPWWSVDSAGFPNMANATIERSLFGEDVNITLGKFENGRFLLDKHTLAELLIDADAVVVYRAVVDQEFMEVVPETCKIIARQGVGVDNLDIEAIRARGMFSFNVPDYCVDETSTHALAFMLALDRGVITQDRAMKSGSWATRAPNIPRRLSTESLGIIGFGRIGKAVARKAQVIFGSVAVYDPYVHSDAIAGLGCSPVVDLRDVLESSYVVSLHAALTDETRQMISRSELATMQEGALLVNTARGALVDIHSVAAALDSGKLGGFACDVWSPEIPFGDPVFQRLSCHTGVITSCHRAFLSKQSDISLRERVAREIRHVLDNELPPRYGRLC